MQNKCYVEQLNSTSDFSEWDAFVDNSPQGSVFCYSWWLRSITNNNFNVIVVKNSNVIVAGMALCYGYNKRIIQAKGPFQGVLLARTNKLKYSEALSDEMEHLSLVARHIPPFDFCELMFHPSLTNWLPFFWSGFSQRMNYTYVINNLHDAGNLWDGLRSGVKTDINKAKRAGLKISPNSNFEVLWGLIVKTYLRQGYKTPPYKYEDLYSRVKASKENSSGNIIIVETDQGVPVAGLFYVWSHGTAYFIISGADPSLRNVGATSFLYWQGCMEAAGVADSVNFCGSMIQSIEHLLRSFGGIQTPYCYIYKDNKSFYQKSISGLRSKAGNLLRSINLR
ncbi:MAG TPA: hypothetical protein DDY22_05700 [Geobacter sp.]|nr:hypothetical protein [Geobacter sp.]